MRTEQDVRRALRVARGGAAIMRDSPLVPFGATFAAETTVSILDWVLGGDGDGMAEIFAKPYQEEEADEPVS